MLTISQMFSGYYTTRSWLLLRYKLVFPYTDVQWLLYYKVMVIIAIQAGVPLHRCSVVTILQGHRYYWIYKLGVLLHRCSVVTILQGHGCYCNRSWCSPSEMFSGYYSGFSNLCNKVIKKLRSPNEENVLVDSSNHLRSKVSQSADSLMALRFSLCCCKDH